MINFLFVFLTLCVIGLVTADVVDFYQRYIKNEN